MVYNHVPYKAVGISPGNLLQKYFNMQLQWTKGLKLLGSRFFHWIIKNDEHVDFSNHENHNSAKSGVKFNVQN